LGDGISEKERPRPLRVLLVDDNEPDVRLFQYAVEGTPVEVSVARDGEEAIERLRRAAEDAASAPELIVLDLHLPRVDGFDVLAMAKRTEGLRSIPVVVLSTSPREADVLRAYREGAASYVVKPGTLDEYLRAIGFLVEYWGRHVRLPKLAGC
jgi:CheY-like chemotaxis protein